VEGTDSVEARARLRGTWGTLVPDAMPVDLLARPRHRRSLALVSLAEQADRAGDRAAARDRWAEAARLEEQEALELPAGDPAVATLLAMAAITLWIRAERWAEAARAAAAFLSRPDLLTPTGRADLEGIAAAAAATAGGG
jgi:hypothetical protein